MISQIVAPGELLVTMRTLIVSAKRGIKSSFNIFVHKPVSTVLCNMPLPVTLHCELKATLIANKWFDAPENIVMSSADILSSELTCEISCAAPGGPL